MGAAEADRTLFVGNLDPRATEELLFELFLQAGPALSVKIPKDKDGNPKLFAFVNFKHEESVPYGMNLLNGIKLFGRPLKIQYRSGSSHASQDANNAASSPQGNGGFSGNGQSSNGNRHDFNSEMRHDLSPPVNYQRSYSSPDSLSRHAMMNNLYRQVSSHAANPEFMSHASSSTSNYPPFYSSYIPSSSHSASVRYDSTHSHRKNRNQASHPYQNDGYHSSRDAYYRGGQEEHYQEERSTHQRKEARYRHSRY